jgi:hypothetical protein
MSLSDTLKDHIVIVVSGVAIGAFGVGWAAYKAVVEAEGQELIRTTQRQDLEKKAEALERVTSEFESCRRSAGAAANTNLAACRTLLATEIDSQYVTRTEVQQNYVLKSQVSETSKPRPRFDNQWRYLSLPNTTGQDVARRLTEIGPPEDAVVIAYDGSSHNTFHVWYRGQGTGTKYHYSGGRGTDLTDPPGKNVFLPEAGLIPAGIGGIGNVAVPIYFLARK